jgi:8-oxo-dGTP pyrophosphatase MutT (NUDIX family)
LSGSRILEVAELDFRLAPYDWPFAVERAREIQSHWEERTKAQPKLFNGRVLLLGRHGFETRADGSLVLRGAYFETDFAAFLAWRDFGFPDASVCNGFSTAALQGSDGVFVLGEMASHTANAGLIYFAAGTPDRQDVFGERVDLEASVTREVEEETGISATETTYDSSWIVVHAPPRVACMKIMRLSVPARTAKARIEDFIAREPHSELAAVHLAGKVDDVDPARTLGFMRDFLSYALAQRSVG